MIDQLTAPDLTQDLPPRVVWQRGAKRIELRYVMGLPVLVLLCGETEMGAWCVAAKARN